MSQPHIPHVYNLPALCYNAGIATFFHGIMDDQQALRAHLAELTNEHRDLDHVIAQLAEAGPVNQIQLQRLKKRKLRLKDEIARLESRLLPDIIA